MAEVAIRMLILMLLTFKKVKLIFGHPVPIMPIQYRTLMTFSHKIQTKTFTWPVMSFYHR